MHICVGKLTIIGLDNGLAHGLRIFWTNAGLLLRPGTSVLEVIFNK